MASIRSRFGWRCWARQSTKQADYRNPLVLNGSNDPLGQNHPRLSQNEARTTPVQVAANHAVDAQIQQVAAPGQGQRKPVSMTT